MTKALKPIVPFGDATPDDVSCGVKFTSEGGFSQTGTGRVEWISSPDGTFTMPAIEQTASVPDLTAAPQDLALGKVAYSKDGFITGTIENIPIVFYDWDDTLLGSISVEKHSTSEETALSIQSFIKTIYSPDSPPGFPDTFPAALDQDAFVDNPAYPLTYKGRYHFAGWVDVSDKLMEEVHTAYETTAACLSDQWIAATPSEMLILKAAYVERSNFPSPLLYTLNAVTYDCYGNPINAATGVIKLKIKVTRQKSDLTWAKRIKNPCFRCLCKLSDNTAFYLAEAIPSSDTVYWTIQIPKHFREIQIVLVNWDKRSDSTINQMGSFSNTLQSYGLTASEGGTLETSHIVKGILGCLNRRAREQNKRMQAHTTEGQGMWTAGIGTYALRTDLGLTVNDAPGIARNKILLLIYAFDSSRSLTLDEIQQILDFNFSSITLPSENPSSTNTVWDEMDVFYSYLDAAFILNNGFLTSVEQVCAALESHGTSLTFSGNV